MTDILISNKDDSSMLWLNVYNAINIQGEVKPTQQEFILELLLN